MARINVTIATRAKLDAILAITSADIIMLQEVRFNNDKPRWLLRLARSLNMGVVVSKPTGVDECKRRRHGGTAIRWKRTLGPVATEQSQDHRAVAIKLPTIALACVYGPAARVDCDWFQGTLDWLAERCEFGLPLVAAGDFNWRRAYNAFLAPRPDSRSEGGRGG